jgi:hypothetical protein
MTEWPRSWGYTQAEEEINAQSRGEQPGKTNHSAGVWRELEFIKFAEMRPRLDGRPLIKGMLERDQTSLIFGASGSGKTFLALDRDLHIAAGLDWFGRKVAQGGVVYVAAEAGRSIANRVVAWRAHHKMDSNDFPFAAVTSPVDLCHRGAGDIDRLIELIQSANLGPFALVEIDIISRAMAGGNENAPDDMGALVHSIDRLRDEMHCHVSAVHHVGKEANKGSRGHSLLHCAVDTEIEVIHNDATGISVATVTKRSATGQRRARLVSACAKSSSVGTRIRIPSQAASLLFVPYDYQNESLDVTSPSGSKTTWGFPRILPTDRSFAVA